MEGLLLADKINRGMGVAARRIGSPYIVFRSKTATSPLSSRNRVIKLNAAFITVGGRFKAGEGYGTAIWQGYFDASYTMPGDYLVGSMGTFFIASQAPLLPVQCIKTNRVLTISRPAQVGAGGYSGLVAETAIIINAGWPASVLCAATRISGNLPETRFGNWTILLPALPGSPKGGDVVIDDSGRNFVIGAAEQTELGWRMTGREVAG